MPTTCYCGHRGWCMYWVLWADNGNGERSEDARVRGVEWTAT